MATARLWARPSMVVRSLRRSGPPADRSGQCGRGAVLVSGCGAGATPPTSCSPASVGPRDHLEKVVVGIIEIDAPSSVGPVDLSPLAQAGVSPVLDIAQADSTEDLIEFVLTDQKCVVLGADNAIHLVKVDGDVIRKLNDEEGSERCWRLETKNVREEFPPIPSCRGTRRWCGSVEHSCHKAPSSPTAKPVTQSYRQVTGWTHGSAVEISRWWGQIDEAVSEVGVEGVAEAPVLP